MPFPEHLETERLLLDMFVESDADELARIYLQPEVVRYLPALDREQTWWQVLGFIEDWERDGFGLWAVRLRGTREFIGRVGLKRHPDWPLPDTVEVGWALDRRYWGRGLATEGALPSLSAGFEHLPVPRIISIVLPQNAASIRVMEKCGLTHRGAAQWKGYDLIWYAIERDEWEWGRHAREDSDVTPPDRSVIR